MSDFEQRLKQFKLVGPSQAYEFRARQLMRSAGRINRRPWLTWSMAACLVLSVGANTYFISTAAPTGSSTPSVQPKATTVKQDDVYVPGSDRATSSYIREYS